MKKCKWISSLVCGLFIVITGTIYGQSSGCNKLPQKAQFMLQKRFPGSHIVTINDLDVDEKTVWETQRPVDCPGIVQGAFGPTTQGYAISLVRKVDKFQTVSTLVFLQQALNGYSIRVLSPASPTTAHTPVISIGRPGDYQAVESGGKIKTHWPMIIYESVGAGASGYFLSGSKWLLIQLSE